MYEATPESTSQARTTQRYAKCIEASKRIVLKALVTPAQMERIGKALAPILAHVGH